MNIFTRVEWIGGRLCFTWDQDVLEAYMLRCQLNAARRAIRLVNRLRPGPTKARHASRVFKKYNQLRRAAA